MVGRVIRRGILARKVLALECYLIGLGGSVGLDRDISVDLAAGDGIGAVAVILDRDISVDLRRGLIIIVKRICRTEGVILSRRRAQAVGGQTILQRHGVTRLDGKLSGASVDLGRRRVLGRGVRAGVDFRRGNPDFRRPCRLCLECQGYDLRGSGLIRAVADDADASALFGYRSPFIRRLTGHIGQPRGVIGQCQIVGIVLSPGDGHAHADGLPSIRSLIRRSGDRIARFRGINSHGQGGQKHYKSKQAGQNYLFHKIHILRQRCRKFTAVPTFHRDTCDPPNSAVWPPPPFTAGEALWFRVRRPGHSGNHLMRFTIAVASAVLTFLSPLTSAFRNFSMETTSKLLYLVLYIS